MTTDINELAQRMKAAAEKATPGQWERGDGKHGGELLVYCDDALGSAVCEATSEYNAIPKYQRIDNLDFIALANPANILALVEALEKAQQERENWRTSFDNERFRADKLKAYIDDMEPIRAAAEKLVRCKGRYHSEQNYRALAALFGVKTPDLPTLEHENVHYADAAEMEIAALRQRIADLESRAVKLPKLKMLEDYLAEVAIEERKQILVGVKLEFHRALAAAGIKVEAE